MFIGVAVLIIVSAVIILKRHKRKKKELRENVEFQSNIFINPLSIFSEFGNNDTTPIIKNPDPSNIIRHPTIEPDPIHDDSMCADIFESMVEVDAADKPFDVLMEHVKGSPLYGKMLQMNDSSRNEFMVKLRQINTEKKVKILENENDVELQRVISGLKKVRRLSSISPH